MVDELSVVGRKLALEGAPVGLELLEHSIFIGALQRLNVIAIKNLSARKGDIYV